MPADSLTGEMVSWANTAPTPTAATSMAIANPIANFFAI
jgi:hypothetical protein